MSLSHKTLAAKNLEFRVAAATETIGEKPGESEQQARDLPGSVGYEQSPVADGAPQSTQEQQARDVHHQPCEMAEGWEPSVSPSHQSTSPPGGCYSQGLSQVHFEAG